MTTLSASERLGLAPTDPRPDNETTPEQDARRIAWAAGDLIENRPALSRWHPEWRDAFAQFMQK